MRVPVVLMIAAHAEDIRGLGGDLTPGDAAAKILGVEFEGAAMFGQHPLWSGIEYLLRAGRIERRKAAVEPHPAAGAAVHVLVEEIVRCEVAAFAVDRRLDSRGELAL